MTLPSVPCLFFLFPLMALCFAHGEDEFPSNCTKGFSCGNIGYLEFPFAKHTQADCGLVAVNCDTTPPKIQFEKGEDWYHLQKVMIIKGWGVNKIIVEDSKLQRLFDRRDCKILNYNIQFRSSPSITLRNFEAYEFSTFLKCNTLSEADDDICNYERYNHCTEGLGYRLYYKYPLIPEDSSCTIPDDSCISLTTPIFIDQTNDTLTAGFGVELQVTDACYHCYYGGGQCRADRNNEFQCKKGKSMLKLILITVHSGGLALILVSLAIFVVWRRKKGSKGYSRNTSSDPTSDLERGCSRFFGILIFSYSELEEATNNFDPSKELGDGGFGTVYYGILGDGREVAVKRLHEFNCKRMEQFANEISILTRLKHRNLVTLYGCSTGHKQLLLVYEYVPNGTVANHLHGKRSADRLLTWPTRMKIAVETAAALVYLHASGIIHRDVKTSNILVDNNFCVKVADFGLSRPFPANVTHATTTPQGTPGYVDPDYHECYQLTYKSDVYSFGVVLIELVSSMPAVDMAKLATNKILTGAFDELIDSSLGYEMDTEIKRMTTSVAELAFQCLQLDKDMRPTMERVLESLKEIQGNELNNGDERVNGEETNVSKEEEVQRKAMRWTWAGPSLEANGTLKHAAPTKNSC